MSSGGARSFAPASVARPDLVVDGHVEMWAVQTPVVLDALERDGSSMVRMSYIDKKYGETAWSFKTAYAWFSREFARAVERPEGAESPVWLYRDSSWAAAGQDCVTLHLLIPAQELVMFDLRPWTRILSLEYLGQDERDEDAFAAELARQGVSSPAEALRSSFYPLVKQGVIASWERLLTSADGCPQTYLQGGVWRLKKDWLLPE
jgi:hypothetical protein